MILELDSQFSTVDLAALPSAYAGIETICLAVARGEHFLAADRATVERFVDDSNLTKLARGIFEWIKAEYAYLTGLFRQFTFRVRIKPDTSPPFRLGPDEWSVSISHIADSGIRPTVLLGENSRDGDLYTEAATHYRLDTKLSGISVRVEPRNGNGGSTSTELLRIDARRNEFCLCITDSDRFSPSVDLGDIGSACKAVVAHSNWVISHDAAQSRELENAIPTKLIEAAAIWAKMPGWNDFSVAEAELGNDAIQHSDVKHGTTMHWIKAIPKHSPNRIFWEGKVAVKFRTSVEEFTCQKNGLCKSDSCTCMVIHPVGSEIAVRVHEFIKLHGPHEILRRARGSSNLNEWLRLGKKVLDAGVAPARRRL